MGDKTMGTTPKTPMEFEQTTTAPLVQAERLVMPEFSVDDRGNVVDFYEKLPDGTWDQCARINREAGPPNDCDAVTTWNGGESVTTWAKINGYEDEINDAVFEA
jgi:hypothetical protein